MLSLVWLFSNWLVEFKSTILKQISFIFLEYESCNKNRIPTCIFRKKNVSELIYLKINDNLWAKIINLSHIFYWWLKNHCKKQENDMRSKFAT